MEEGGIEWGHAADDKLAYVAISDRIVKDGKPGLYALDLATGQQKWAAPAPTGIPGNPAQSGMWSGTTPLPMVSVHSALLPNGKIKAGSVLPAAVAMGVLWEVGKVLYIKALPLLNFQEVYGQAFSVSVALMFWAFISGLMLLAGAHLSSDFTPEAAEAAEEKDEIEFK